MADTNSTSKAQQTMYDFFKKHLFIVYSVLILIISFFTHFYNYQYPPAPFWDENYHIASAQKYIDGYFFMELHPPLGKMLIALGEVIFNPNSGIDKKSFNDTQYIQNFPANFSFAGVRFFPALLGWLSVWVFFILLFHLTKNHHLSFILTSVYAFENAMIVHFRGAMLESIQMFFILVSLAYFAYIWKKDPLKWFHYLLLGVCISFVIATKINGLILILLPIFLWLKEYVPSFDLKSSFSSGLIRKTLVKVIAFSVGLASIYCAIFYIHFSIGTKISEQNNYSAETSQEYKDVLARSGQSNPINFLIQLRDYTTYQNDYAEKVPALDICKSGENGSYPLTWPFGNKSISYRWEKRDGKVRYLYLQGNPLIWLLGLMGILLSVVLLLGRIFFGTPIKDRNLFNLISVFCLMYLSYMAAVLPVTRVLYLYHYFIPLVFSLILFCLLLNYWLKEYLAHEKVRGDIYAGLSVLVLMIVAVFVFYSPLTYYLPLSTSEFNQRNWFPFWKLQVVE